MGRSLVYPSTAVRTDHVAVVVHVAVPGVQGDGNGDAGLMAAVGILRASGFLDFLASLIGQFSSHIGFPGELIPLSIVKMFSSSAATGLLLDIYKNFGTDSRLGQIASISMCCTETIFYTMSVYFMTAGIKKSRYTLAGALIATFAGLAASVLLAGPG